MHDYSLVGKVLGDRYRIDELIGQGGMSAVYKAFDPNLKRLVAIKVIHPHLASDSKFVLRFEDEAAAVAQLSHPNIVQVFDFNHDENLYYMVQEFLPGETLQELLRRLSASGSFMPLAEVVQYTQDICEAAGYAHQRGMIHRDIKPANILLNVNNRAILMDFGIVKITGDVSHTTTGAVVGTALYMPPELIREETPDARADIYSLGVTLFEMISGRPPFEADSAMSLMMMHVRDPLPNMHHIRPDVPDELIAIVSKALAKEPHERYSSMSEFAAELKGWLDQTTAGAIQQDVQAAGAVIAVGMATQQDDTLHGAEAGDSTATLVEAAAPVSPLEGMIPNIPAPAVASASNPMADAPAPAVSSREPAARKKVHLAIWISLIAVILCVVTSAIGVGLVLSNRFGGRDASADLAADAAAAAVLAVEENATESLTQTPTETPLPTTTPSPTLSPTATITPSPTLSPTPTLSLTPTIPPNIPYVRINDIQLDESGKYVVDYETFEFVEELPGTHIHFFFDTVLPEEAGLPGSGPWKLYGGPRPFSGYHQDQRPEEAIQLCSLVANPDHSVQDESGTCYDLPDVVLASALLDTDCLEGPDPAFPVASRLSTKQRLRVLGMSADEKWWVVVHPNNPDESCWLAQEVSSFSGDISTLGLVESPALPETLNHSVEITGITLGNDGSYVVEYVTEGFVEALPGTHLHFFFNTTRPEDSGMGSSGDRLMYGGPSPFRGYKVGDKPATATELCVLVAEPSHTIILESGNCMELP